MTRSHIGVVVVVAMTLASVGCVGQQGYDDLLVRYRTCEEQLIELSAQVEERDVQIAEMQRTMDAAKSSLSDELASLRQERDKLSAQLSQAEQKIQELADTPPVVEVAHVVPVEVDSALRELAQMQPELMTYDAEQGMVKLRSDMTFALGSTDVKQAGVSALGQLAGIINIPAAAQYEVRVVGHTDNVPINRVREKHPTNWHLSVHRAIAVKDVLHKSGVSATRLGVSGYGEYRPLAQNGPKGNRANRRVEIFLVPISARDDALVELEVDPEAGVVPGGAESDPEDLQAAVEEPDAAFK